jgi:hypothetical protein
VSTGPSLGEVLCLFILVFVGWLLGTGLTEKKYRQEAVDHGAAEWVVDNQGHVEFKWKDGK